MEIIVKKWEHYNRAMGKYIKSKRHYMDEMKKGGYVPFDEGCKLADKKKREQEWKPSKECVSMMREVMDKKGKDRKIVLGKHPRLVKGMKKLGVTFELPSWFKKLDEKKGGGFTDGM